MEPLQNEPDIIDANTIVSTQEYDKLPETYVIFITENDVLKKNLPIYHIDRVIQETNEYFGDESHIIYVNGAYQDDTPLGILMKDFSCSRPEYYKPLYERTKYFTETEEGVAIMCKMMEDMRNEAIIEATREAAIKTASKLLRFEKLSCEKVSEYTNLPLEEVKKLAKELGA